MFSNILAAKGELINSQRDLAFILQFNVAKSAWIVAVNLVHGEYDKSSH
jgi:hypothetical protein